MPADLKVSLREHLELREEVKLLKQNHEYLSSSLDRLHDEIAEGFATSSSAQTQITKLLVGEDGTDGLVGRVKDLETSNKKQETAALEDRRGRWSVRAAIAAGMFSLLTVIASAAAMWAFAL